MKDRESELVLIVIGCVIALLLILLGVLRRFPRCRRVRDGDNLSLIHVPSQRNSSESSCTSQKISKHNLLNLDPSLRVTYITDVEGNWEYLRAYVQRSEGLVWVGEEEGGARARIDLKDGWRFIFGGDVVDKGGRVGGSLRVTRTLIHLKRRYPLRVTLLLGNRDANKMRLTSELHPSQLKNELLRHLPGPSWVPHGPKHVTPERFLRQLAVSKLEEEEREAKAAAAAAAAAEKAEAETGSPASQGELGAAEVAANGARSAVEGGMVDEEARGESYSGPNSTGNKSIGDDTAASAPMAVLVPEGKDVPLTNVPGRSLPSPLLLPHRPTPHLSPLTP